MSHDRSIEGGASFPSCEREQGLGKHWDVVSSRGEHQSKQRPDHSPRIAIFETMAILACFSSDRHVLTTGEIARMIPLAEASVDEHADTLVRCGYLEPAASSAYRLSEQLPKGVLLACC